MKLTFLPHIELSKADAIVLPFWEGLQEAAPLGTAKEAVQGALQSGDFRGKAQEALLVYASGKRFLLLGLGKEAEITVEQLRKSFAQAVSSVRKVKAKSMQFLFPHVPKLRSNDVMTGVWEGIFLSNYAFTKLRNDTLKEVSPLLETVLCVGKEDLLIAQLQTLINGVHFARDLVNGNADDVTPHFLAETARSLSQVSSKVKVLIHDRKWIEKEKMGLLLAVHRASSVEPYLIEVSYKGDPTSKEHTVLVGKGVSYDTGGLALKPVDGMLTMKMDMAGAAAVLGTIKTVAELGLKVNVTVVVPTVENCIDALSYKHGDVYTSHSGKTVEVNNTDAEGRLILADAISYAVKNLEPTRIIDVATLTGAVVVALGEHVAGFCSNDDALSDKLLKSGDQTGEWLCRLPLVQEYYEAFKSDIADMTNSGGRDAGSIKGALFIQQFVGSMKWAHLDIAGAAYWTKPKYYHPTRATGYGVRLLVQFLSS